MVDLLIGNRNVKELDFLCQKLANDKKYRIKNVVSGIDALNMYWKTNPDILVLDNNLDMPIETIIDRLSINPIEQKKCNTILTLTPNYIIKLNNFAKINRIIYKPLDNKLIDAINILTIDYNTPDLEVGEVDWLLQSLNFNCMSTGYKFMKDAIIYCYYRPNELEFLSTILKKLASKYNVPESRVRDVLNSSLRPFNNSAIHNCSADLYALLNNKGQNISLKVFLERIVFYLIRTKNKGRIN